MTRNHCVQIAFGIFFVAFFPCTNIYADEVPNKFDDSSIILGFLEDIPGVYAGESNSFSVRVAFKKDGENWEAFPSHCLDQNCLKNIVTEYPQEVEWNILFDGRSLGKIVAQTPDDFHFYSHSGLQEIVSDVPIPTIGKKSVSYSGFESEPVFRPLVANSQPYFKDPESWKSVQLSAEHLKVVRETFRKKFPHLCKIDPKDETKLISFPYRDDQIIVTKAYASNKGWAIAELIVKQAIDCEDTGAGFGMDDQWFAISPQRTVKYIDEGMWLVDAGDYDDSGKSVLVFAISRYDRGGYELFYDNFEKNAVFEYIFH